jgi:DNA-directed DNA polymerase III PolC
MRALRPRSIVHLDADAFFASVEQAADPRLRGKPIAVGGEKRGVIASASYEARRFGIYTPMPTAMARRLCPKLILLPGDFEKYELFSRLMFSYAYDFTPDVEIGSIDEGYFDLTAVPKPAPSIAEKIRQAIRQSLKLPVSEGVGSNKLISQVASKLKKPSAFEIVPTGSEASFLAPLANLWLPGIGPKTADQLNAAGLARIGQIGQAPVELLGLLVGKLARQLHQFALGIDERPVIPARAPAQSYGQQETFGADITDEEFAEATLRHMADKLMAKVRGDARSIRTVTVKVRYNDMDEVQVSESLPEPTDAETEIYSLTSRLLRKAWQRRVSLRLVSLKLSNLYDQRFSGELTLDSSTRQRQAREKLAGVVDVVRQRYGEGAVMRGHDFVLKRKPEDAARDCHVKGSDAELREKPVPYGILAAQRQRLGHSAALLPPEAKARQVVISPGVELKFRFEVPQKKNAATSDSGARIVARARQIAAPVPLNVHSYYSFLNSTLSVQAIVDLAVRHQLPAIALTDINNLHGVVEFCQTATAAGIQPIVGAELHWQNHQACVYVENERGYYNLCAILNRLEALKSTQGGTKPSESQPLLSHGADILQNTEGLLAVSRHAELAAHFPGRFYLETGEPMESAPALPCVASLPVHYETPADRWKYDIVQSIRTLTLLRQTHPEKRLDGEYHFPTPAEWRARFAKQPQLLTLTQEIAERCQFRVTARQPQFPSFTPPGEQRPAEFLRELSLAGLRRRYPREHNKLQAQLEEELAIITDVGYEEYFLVMWDILQDCHRRGIDWITRGSAADSLVCYCLGISGVCPIRFDLYFRRFLNKERMALNKLPDIDVDFPHDRKDDVVDLIFEKYGHQQAAVVGGFSTFQSRSAFAEVAKVLGVSDYQARRITERLPYFSRASELQSAIRESIECRNLPLDEEPYSTALQMACFLDGFPRYAKMHPCGVVLSRQPMAEITPCFTSAKGYPTTHLDMDSVETVGLIKMDILAQGGLAVMRDVKESLVRSGIPSPDLEALEPWEDSSVWELIAGGNARAVHHIESPAMISLCKMCNARDIDTLIAIVSVIRPGAANESKKMEFARRYQGLSPVRYPHPSLESCLRSTYGLVVYEEHILQICEAFAGLPPGRADVLRRALGKDKTEIIDQIAIEFADCARRLHRTEEDIRAVWDLVVGFKGYAFCKAHSTAYGVEAYQAAWLKHNYPAEFMAAVLTNGKGFYSPLVYILECHRLGIPILPPSINDPGPAFSVRDHCIRVPALNVKGLTKRTTDAILRESAQGAFASLADFLLRVRPWPEEVQALIQAGAFDTFGQSRTAQFWEFRSVCADAHLASSPTGARPTATPAPRQLWLLPPGNLDRLHSVPLDEPAAVQKLRWEEELLGYPVSDHPLALYPDIAWETYCPINRLHEYIGKEIVTCGMVIEQRTFHQVTGEPMKFLTIADHTGIIETELFARTYKSYGLNTVRYRVLEITATVEPFENGRGHTLRVLRAGKPRTRRT